MAGPPEHMNISANWSRLPEAGGRPELDLALAGRAGGRVGRSLWAAAFHIIADHHGLSRLLIVFAPVLAILEAHLVVEGP